MGSLVKEDRKLHVVCIPFPAQGHINAMLRLAKLLYSHHDCHVTFIHKALDYQQILDSSGGAHDVQGFNFETFDAELVLDRPEIHQPFCGPTRDVLTRITTRAVPAVTCVIYDVFMSYVAELAEEIGVPRVAMCPISACSFMGFLWTEKLVERGVVPMKDESYITNGHLDTLIDIIPGLGSLRLRDLPSYTRTTNPDDILLKFCIQEMQKVSRANAVIIHTFEDLEHHVLDALSEILPPLYSIGPLSLLTSKIQDVELNSIGSSLWKEDSKCVEWLDSRGAKSVIYVNLGSIVTLTENQVNEIAWGIANSGHDFLWVMRPDIVKSTSVLDTLPAEFFKDTEGRGHVTSWCMQEEILRHPAIGGFLTHCGWNSTMEAIAAGVPVLCWPVFADQPTNCRYLCKEWEMGLEIDENLTRFDIEEKIREILGEGEGKILRNNAEKWKESATRATEKGGTSWINLERLIKEVMLV